MARRRRSRYGYGGFGWKPYVPVAQRRAKAARHMEKHFKNGEVADPVRIDGRTIARSFWGRRWCEHLESFADYENRLPRGRSYVRNGSVCHLEIHTGVIEAMVSGSSLYKVRIAIKELAKSRWDKVRQQCAGQIGSMLELLQGRFSDSVMAVVSDRQEGLFPEPREIECKCSCPDWAYMCKHVAAVLYGVGSRLDVRPELLFTLRGVDAAQLVTMPAALPLAAGEAKQDTLAETGLEAIFGIEIDTGSAASASAPAPRTAARRTAAAEHPRTQARKTESKTEARGRGKTGKKASVAARSHAKLPKAGRRGAKPFDPAAPTGPAIAAMRKAAALTVAQFADAVGVSPASVTRWEATSGALRLYSRQLKALTTFAKRQAS